MNRLISLVIIVVMMAAMFAGCGEASAADTKHFHEVADGMTEAMISDYGVTSVQYAIIDNGEIVFSGNDGEYAKGADTAITKGHDVWHRFTEQNVCFSGNYDACGPG